MGADFFQKSRQHSYVSMRIHTYPVSNELKVIEIVALGRHLTCQRTRAPSC